MFINSAKMCKDSSLKEFDYNNETLMIAPAAGFYSTDGEGYNQVRIAYVLKKDLLEKAVLCIKKALEVYQKSF